jgi:hypothetical protein
MGYFSTASGVASTAMGYWTTAPSYGETAIGIFNTAYTPIGTTEFNAADRLFVIGNGTFGAGSNAMTVLKSGNVGIGTATPTQKLEVSGTTKTTDINVTGTANIAAWANQSLTPNGFARMGGLLIQWGTESYLNNGISNVTFPTPFTTMLSISTTLDAGANTGNGANTPCKVLNTTLIGFQFAGTAIFSGDNVSKVRWMAIGL